MKYALTIYGDEAQRENATPEQMQEVSQAYGAVTQEMQDNGVLVAGEGLYPTPTATTLRVREGDRQVTDGPFAETKEQLLGFYIIDGESPEGVLGIARDLARANPGGSYEIRPGSLYLPGTL
jgi:hypothetical protein